MTRSSLLLAAIAVIFGALAACIDASSIEFSCMSDAQCDLEAEGVCSDPGWCAYPDGSCDSELRFDPSAGDGLGGMCVDADAPSSSG